jgi:hypothetical protein
MTSPRQVDYTHSLRALPLMVFYGMAERGINRVSSFFLFPIVQMFCIQTNPLRQLFYALSSPYRAKYAKPLPASSCPFLDTHSPLLE